MSRYVEITKNISTGEYEVNPDYKLPGSVTLYFFNGSDNEGSLGSGFYMMSPDLPDTLDVYTVPVVYGEVYGREDGGEIISEFEGLKHGMVSDFLDYNNGLQFRVYRKTSDTSFSLTNVNDPYNYIDFNRNSNYDITF